jgi:hypothetical protein
MLASANLHDRDPVHSGTEAVRKGVAAAWPSYVEEGERDRAGEDIGDDSRILQRMANRQWRFHPQPQRNNPIARRARRAHARKRNLNESTQHMPSWHARWCGPRSDHTRWRAHLVAAVPVGAASPRWPQKCRTAAGEPWRVGIGRLTPPPSPYSLTPASRSRCDSTCGERSGCSPKICARQD